MGKERLSVRERLRDSPALSEEAEDRSTVEEDSEERASERERKKRRSGLRAAAGCQGVGAAPLKIGREGGEREKTRAG